MTMRRKFLNLGTITTPPSATDFVEPDGHDVPMTNRTGNEPYTMEGLRVMQGGRLIAVAPTGNLARRVVNALRAYKVGPRGY